jgi:lipoate---protein ligase
LRHAVVKAEEKISNGKLVCVEVLAEGGRISRLRITGDFFLHPEEAIGLLEGALSGQPLSIAQIEAESLLISALGDAQLIGASPADLARLIRKAVG